MTKTYLSITFLVIFASILISSMASSNMAGNGKNYQVQNQKQTPELTITLLPSPSTLVGTEYPHTLSTNDTLSTPIGPQPEYSNQVRVIITFGVMTVIVILIGLGINIKRIR